MDYIHILCACSSFEHQAIFYDCDDMMYVSFHLRNKSFIKRLTHAIRYVFGYKSRFGAWDEFIFDEEGEVVLFNFLKQKHEKSN